MPGHFPPIFRHPENIEGLPGLYLAHFLDALTADSDHQRALMTGAGISENALADGRKVPLKQVLDLIEGIDRWARPGWHIEPALGMEAAHHGPLGVAIISAPTVAQALDTLIRFEAVRAPFVHLQPLPGHGDWRVRVIATVAAEGPWQVLMEINLLALAGLIQRLLGPQARRLRLHLPHGYRAWEKPLLQALPGQVQLVGKDYALTLPGELLGQTCRLADRRLHADARARCEALMAERFDGSPLEAEIRRRLLANITDPPDQLGMARALGLSSRSLHRRLADRGRGYRQLVGEVRAAVAAHRLRNTRDPIADIATDLGYQDVANFGRACRRWFGRSPGRLRNDQP
ncbi:MAG: helix-turn-helix domain-containing protein [Wenzhouxiangella sp.]|jgi:AraC-like DNA-binding protein|nr:helix-turn-helix domain-containing protein [Wenzhouxiangella sp.]